MNSKIVKPKVFGSAATGKLKVWDQEDGDKVLMVFAIEEMKGRQHMNGSEVPTYQVECQIGEGYTVDGEDSQFMQVIVMPGQPVLRKVRRL